MIKSPTFCSHLRSPPASEMADRRVVPQVSALQSSLPNHHSPSIQQILLCRPSSRANVGKVSDFYFVLSFNITFAYATRFILLMSWDALRPQVENHPFVLVVSDATSPQCCAPPLSPHFMTTLNLLVADLCISGLSMFQSVLCFFMTTTQFWTLSWCAVFFCTIIYHLVSMTGAAVEGSDK
jgi:hypothetical protein